MEPLLLTWSSVLWRSMQSSNGPVYTSLHRHRQLLIERSPTLMPAMSVRGPSGGFFKLFFFIIYWRVLRSVIDLNSTHRFCWGEEKVLKFLFVRLISFFGATKRKNWIFFSPGRQRKLLVQPVRVAQVTLFPFWIFFGVAWVWPRECDDRSHRLLSLPSTPFDFGCVQSTLKQSNSLNAPPPFNPLKFYRGNTFFIVQTVSVVSHQGPVWILESPLSLIYFLSFF